MVWMVAYSAIAFQLPSIPSSFIEMEIKFYFLIKASIPFALRRLTTELAS
jgi:hypothetical protein